MRLARAVQPNQVGTAHIPAPVGGKNLSVPGGAMPPTDCIECENLIAGDIGLKTRQGYQEWVTGMTDPVRTVVPFNGSTAAKDRLFAVTNADVYDCTSSADGPSSAYSLSASTGNAGWLTYTAYSTSAAHFLLAACPVNGLLRYTDTTALGQTADTWAAVATGTGTGEISGVTAANVNFVTTWKNRLWFCEKDTATAWYLPVGVVAGVATAFYFGNKFRAGGHLVGLYNMTIDGGTGADDYLVALSSGGDVLVYQGTDPDSAIDFQLRGEFYVGGFPAGNRAATPFGGDVLLLTRTGIFPVSKLLAGQGVNPDAYTTKKIGPEFVAKMASTAAVWGWSIRQHPGDQALIVTVPDTSLGYEFQFAQSLDTGGWATYTNMPMVSADAWNGTFYFGSASGVLYKATGSIDNVARAGSTAAAVPIDFKLLTAFSNLGNGMRKQLQMIRAHTQAAGLEPSVAVSARYDFNRTALTGTAPSIAVTGDVWDTGVWDSALWGTSTAQPYGKWKGVTGIGTNIAVAMLGRASVQTTLVGFDIAWRQTGNL